MTSVQYETLLGLSLINADEISVNTLYTTNEYVDYLYVNANSYITLENDLKPVSGNTVNLGDATLYYQTCYSAKDYMDNLYALTGSNITLNNSLLPVSNNTLNLGSSSLYYANIYTDNLYLYGLTAKCPIFSSSSQQLQTQGPMTNGQLIIGNTGNLPSLATLSAGASGNFNITNSAGGITLDVSLNPTFTTVTTTGNIDCAGTLKTNIIDSHSGSTITLLEETTVNINGSNALQVQNTGGSPYFSVNTISGAITSTYNSFDDGSGNMYLNYTSATTSPYVKWEVNSVNKMKMFYDTTNGIQIYDMANTSEWLYQGSTTKGEVLSKNNCLDNGTNGYLGINTTSPAIYLNILSSTLGKNDLCYLDNGNIAGSTGNGSRILFRCKDALSAVHNQAILYTSNTTTDAKNSSLTLGVVVSDSMTDGLVIKPGGANVVVNSANSTLDDGNGNMNIGTLTAGGILTIDANTDTTSASANSGITMFNLNTKPTQAYKPNTSRIKFGLTDQETEAGNTGSNFRIWTYDDSGGFLNNGLTITRSNSKLSSLNNTLDDGSGNITINGNDYRPLNINSTKSLAGTDYTGINLQWSGTQKFQVGWDSGAGFNIYDNINSAYWLYQNGSTKGNVQSYKNVLDDGSGNITIAGTSTLNAHAIITTSSDANAFLVRHSVGGTTSFNVATSTDAVTTKNSTVDAGDGSSIFAGTMKINGNANLPSACGGALYLTAGYNSPVSGRIFFGDGTGWKMYFSKRTSSTNTDLFEFDDNGSMIAKSLSVNGDNNYIAGTTTFTGSTAPNGANTATIKAVNTQNSAGWIKVYVGATTAYIPYFTQT